jgi:hypothetical protein
MLPNEQLDDLYKQIKITGTKAEVLLNEWIKSRMNKKEIAGLFGRRKTKWYARILNNLQETVETVSVPLNIPTKRDVAGVAKLTLQNEEKLEDILQRLVTIEKSLQRIESALNSNPKSVNQPSQHSKGKPLSRQERTSLFQENLAKLSKALLEQSKIGE